MSLPQTAVSIRPRTNWESLDLGFAMARRWYWPLAGLWLMTALPVALALGLTLSNEEYWPFFLWWWFKPLYEWPLLSYLSQRVFTQPDALRTSVNSLRWRSLRHLLPYLLWRRISFYRAFTMPVGMLEGLRGQARAKRVGLLCKQQSYVTWLLVACAQFEAVVSTSVYLGFMLFFYDPVSSGGDAVSYFFQEVLEIPLLAWGTFLLQSLVITPFYVAAAFAAYLSRRTQLEAWDLELVFRRLGERLNETARKTDSSVQANTQRMHSLVALSLLALSAIPLASWTQESMAQPVNQPQEEAQAPRPPADPDDARALIEEVKAGPDFGRVEAKSYWRYRGDSDSEAKERDRSSRIEGPAWVDGLAQVMQILMWLAAFALILWLARYLLLVLGWIQPPAARLILQDGVNETELLRADEPAQEILAQAQIALAQGHYREALALLYRASLGRLIEQYDLRVPVSATEGECRRLVERSCSTLVNDYFARLTRLWVQVAYGHRQATAEQVGQLLHEWPQVLSAAPEHQPEAGSAGETPASRTGGGEQT